VTELRLPLTGATHSLRTPRIGALAAASPRIAERSRARSIPSVPPHVGVLVGLSVAGYALSLAGVTGLQATSEAAIVANRAPVAAALDQLVAGHDRLGADLKAAADRYSAAAAQYGVASDRLATYEQSLGSLTKIVAAVDGVAGSMPASVALPPVVRVVHVAAAPAAAHVTSGGTAKP
jgi:hypothetical protein